MTDETPFDKKIDKVVDAVTDRAKAVAKDINHVTDNIAKAVVDLVTGGNKSDKTDK
jgi:hypothetical protein